MDYERKNPIIFGPWGQRSGSTSALCVRLCGHDTDYIFPIIFKLYMQVVRDERRNPIEFGYRGQISRSILAPLRGDAMLCVA